MVDSELLKMLVCPQTKEPVALADATLIDQLNARIQERNLLRKDGKPVTEPLESGLLRADGKVFYPIRDDIPVMLVPESIPIESEE
ncbi:MAG TPA: hypothetical protein EYM25_08365 [Deltaproteobacteria bacterium]|nr:hypothetical protein [Deltaproteobacteria bacterium]